MGPATQPPYTANRIVLWRSYGSATISLARRDRLVACCAVKSPIQKPAKEVALFVSRGLATSDVQYAAHNPRADGSLSCALTGLPSGVAPAKTPILKDLSWLAGADCVQPARDADHSTFF